jgi:uncharacterized Zn finger protein
MKCPNCGSLEVIVEALQQGDKRVKCPKCGFNEILDDKGRKLLIDSNPSGNMLS